MFLDSNRGYITSELDIDNKYFEEKSRNMTYQFETEKEKRKLRENRSGELLGVIYALQSIEEQLKQPTKLEFTIELPFYLFVC